MEHFSPGGGEEIGILKELDRRIAKERRQRGARGNREVGTRRGKGVADAVLGFDVDVGKDGDAWLGKAVLDGGEYRGVDPREGGRIIVSLRRQEGEIGRGTSIEVMGQRDGREAVDVQKAGISTDTEMNGVAGVGQMDGEPGAEISSPDNGNPVRHDLSESHFI